MQGGLQALDAPVGGDNGDGEDDAPAPALPDGSPILFKATTTFDSGDLSLPVRQAEARARRRFLGDDHLMLAAGRAWPVCLADGTWWTFEVLTGDRLTATAGSLLREMLPAVLEWRAEPAAAARTFAPYQASGAHMSLHIRPGSVPWVAVTIRWSEEVTLA